MTATTVEPFAQIASCRIVCRPNRRERRVWTARDVARVARYANESGAPWGTIIGGVLAGAGLTVLICTAAPRLARMLLWWAAMRRITARIGFGLAAIALLRRVSQVIAAIGLRFPSRVAAAIVAIAAFGYALAVVLEKFTDLERDMNWIQRVSVVLTEWCEAGAGLVPDMPELPDIEIPDPADFNL